MESLYLLIPISIAVVVVGVLVFVWAVNDGQYDDLEGEAERILFDDLDTEAESVLMVDERESSGSTEENQSG